MSAGRLSVIVFLVIFGVGWAIDGAADDKGAVVVELFTSQGCSSCPSADVLLAKLDADAVKSGQAVYCLSFHVDYWNRLGWKDPFSDPFCTQRQVAYAKVLGLQGVYTPQLVVNGADEFVGSDQKRAAKAIEQSLSRETSTKIELKATADGESIAVEYSLKDVPAGAVLNVAWTQAEAVSHPDRGENDGRKLRHINVVRDFRTVELSVASKGKLALNRLDVETGTVIAFVQEVATGKVLGAMSTKLPAKPQG